MKKLLLVLLGLPTTYVINFYIVSIIVSDYDTILSISGAMMIPQIFLGWMMLMEAFQ